MDILYSSSDSYAFLTGISILSLLENNKSCDRIHIYIMDNHISAENKDKLIKTVEKYKRTISFVSMPDMKKLTGRDIETGRWNISTFGRLFMASSLPKDVHTVLNIDCDTIIEGSLESIFEEDMSGKVFAGVSECMNYRYRLNIGLNKEDYYFNAGVVYLNLDEVRENNFEKRFVEYISKYGDTLAYLDQDVLNAVVPQEKKKLLSLKYDVLSIYYYATYKELMKIRRASVFYDEKEFSESKNNPVIVHFTTCFLDGLRPWMPGNKHPYRQKFLNYKSDSLWVDEKLWCDNRNTLTIICQKTLNSLPKCIMKEIASVLHGVIVPNINNIKMKRQEKGDV